MKNFKFNKISKIVLAVIFTMGLVGTVSVFAAPPGLGVTPSLGPADDYGVLSSSYINTSPTTITGAVGFTTGPAVAPLGTHLYYGSGVPYSTAGTDQGSKLSALAQTCDYTFPAGDVDLATDTAHVTALWGSVTGEYIPGVYCTTATSAASIGTAGITLKGAGTYIFRIDGALTTVVNSHVTLDGASSCNVFWTPTAATTLGANTTFVGTVIDAAGITVGHNTGWNGRALAFGGTVTTDTNKIDSTCLATNPTVLVDEVIPTPSVSQSHSSSGGILFGCKDPNATNYNYFSASNPALCVYANIPVVTPLVVTPLLPKTGFPPQTWYGFLLNNFLNLFR